MKQIIKRIMRIEDPKQMPLAKDQGKDKGTEKEKPSIAQIEARVLAGDPSYVGNRLRFVPESEKPVLQNDKEFLLKLAAEDTGRALEFASAEALLDKNQVISMLRQKNPGMIGGFENAFKKLGAEMQADPDVAIEFLRRSAIEIILHLPVSLKSNQEFVNKLKAEALARDGADAIGPWYENDENLALMLDPESGKYFDGLQKQNSDSGRLSTWADIWKNAKYNLKNRRKT